VCPRPAAYIAARTAYPRSNAILHDEFGTAKDAEWATCVVALTYLLKIIYYHAPG